MRADERDRIADWKQIVAQGYDRVAERYVEWSRQGGSEPRERFIALLLERLPEGVAVLDLGCGTGALATQRLAERFAVTAVDISARSIELAKRNVPGTTFVHASMTVLDFP